jgi:prophage regulatory protein
MARMLSRADLRDRKGIRYSRQHIHRLVRRGLFPRPIKMGAGSGTNAWIEDEIDDYLRDRVAERDAKHTQKENSAAVAEASA